MEAVMLKSGRFAVKCTPDEYASDAENGGGMCILCGEFTDCIEPDAENSPCDCCDEPGVYGLEQLLLLGRIKFTS